MDNLRLTRPIDLTRRSRHGPRGPRGRSAAALVGATVLGSVLSACGLLDTRDSEQVADEARGHMDELAEVVGDDPRVTQDEIALCDPKDDRSGDLLFYGVEVDTTPGARRRLRGEVADRYREDGWDVRERDRDTVVFARDEVTMGVRFTSEGTLASIGGSGGCVR